MFCYLHVGVRRGHQTNAAETLTLLVFDERQKEEEEEEEEEETIFQENHKSTKGDNQSSSVNINIFIDDRSN